MAGKGSIGCCEGGTSAGNLGFSFSTISCVTSCESLNNMSWFFHLCNKRVELGLHMVVFGSGKTFDPWSVLKLP